MKAKRKALIFAAFAIVFLLGTLVGYAFSQNGETATYVIESGSLNVPASYIIARNSTHSYVRDGETGEIVYANTQDAYTFAEARNRAYEQGGGLIFVKAGTYMLTLSIGARANLHWMGEGKSTIIKGPSDSIRYFYVTNNNSISNIMFVNLTIEGTSSGISNLRIENCWFYNKPTLYPIRLSINSNSSDIYIINNYFETADKAIYMPATGASHATFERIIISGNIIKNCNTAAIEANDAGGYVGYNKTLRHILIHDNIISGCNYAIRLCGIEGSNYCFYIEDASVHNNQVVNCNYGIQLSAYTYNSFIHDNYLQTTYNAILGSGVGTVKVDNVGDDL